MEIYMASPRSPETFTLGIGHFTFCGFKNIQCKTPNVKCKSVRRDGHRFN